jgi:hypothetical protein
MVVPSLSFNSSARAAEKAVKSTASAMHAGSGKGSLMTQSMALGGRAGKFGCEGHAGLVSSEYPGDQLH